MGKAKNYLYTIAGNLCRNFSRQAKTVSSDDEQLEERLSESEQAHAGPKDAVEKKDYGQSRTGMGAESATA